jgi:hypothetical protein
VSPRGRGCHAHQAVPGCLRQRAGRARFGHRRGIGRTGADAHESRGAVGLAVVDDQLEQIIAGLIGEEHRPCPVDALQFARAAGRPFLERPQIRQAVAIRIAGEAPVDFDVGTGGDVAVAPGTGHRRAIDVEQHFGREQPLHQALEPRRNAQPHRHTLGKLDIERVETIAGDGIAAQSVIVQCAEHRDRCAGVIQALQVDGRGEEVWIVNRGGDANRRRRTGGDAGRRQLHRPNARCGPGAGKRQQQAGDRRQCGRQSGEKNPRERR